ncbi:hypothetical protein SERLA73DRAFT_176969, partial [Serpula lacrymans var. lacrymans S7.3]
MEVELQLLSNFQRIAGVHTTLHSALQDAQLRQRHQRDYQPAEGLGRKKGGHGVQRGKEGSTHGIYRKCPILHNSKVSCRRQRDPRELLNE